MLNPHAIPSPPLQHGHSAVSPPHRRPPSIAAERQVSVQTRVTQLETLLGDPTQTTNPAGYRALLSADRAAILPTHAQGLLRDFAISEEFVPRDFGGQFESLDTLIGLLRPVFRRDLCLGMGHGLTTFMASTVIWLSGSDAQRSWCARLVRDGGTMSLTMYDTPDDTDRIPQVLAHGGPNGYQLIGTKPVIDNLTTARALVMFCRGDTPAYPQAFVLDQDTLGAAGSRLVPCGQVRGLRACRRHGIRFEDCSLPVSARLGNPREAVAVAQRSFQINRSILAAATLAAVDTGLRTTVRFVHRGQSARARTSPDRHAGALVDAFVDLLWYDSLAQVAIRTPQLVPGQASVYSAAVKYLMPKALIETMFGLSTVLGSAAYLGHGPGALFQKQTRDIWAVTGGHGGSLACQATVIPQLRHLAKHSWFTSPAAPGALFTPSARLPPLRIDALSVSNDHDGLSASLVALTESFTRNTPVTRVLGDLARQFVAELHDLRNRVLALPIRRHGDPPHAACLALSDRYFHVLAAAAVMGVWWHTTQTTDPFLADPAWAAAALHRLARRLAMPSLDLPAECAQTVHREVLARFRTPHSYDLGRAPVAG